jgi:tetratricopeptide (TPR) repeat protein
MLRNRVRLLIVLCAIAACLGGLYWAFGPHVRAWYHLHAAESALESYHDEEALNHLRTCLATTPDNPRALLLAARACRRLERYEEAAEYLNRIPATSQGTVDTTLEWSMQRAAIGDLQGDIEEFLQSRAREPENAPLIWEALAVGYTRMSRARDAVRILDDWLKFQPDNPQAHYLRGDFYRKLGSMQKAVPDFRRAVELDPGRVDAHRGLAVALHEIGRFEEALEHLDVVRRSQPADAKVEVLRARCLGQVGQMEQAVSLLDGVLASEPENASALRARGELAMLAGQPALAEDWLRRAVKAAPHDYPANWGLYQALLQQNGKKAEAEKQLAQVQAIKELEDRMSEIRQRRMSERPHDPALHVEMAQLQIKLGHKDMGERWFHTALSHDPDYWPAHAALADFYAAEGNEEKAAYHRQQAERTRPVGAVSTEKPSRQ